MSLSPIQIPNSLPADFPAELQARAILVLGEATKEFPVQRDVMRAVKRVISAMTPDLCNAVKNGVLADSALSHMGSLLDSFLKWNSGGSAKNLMGYISQTRQCDEWRSCTRAIAEADNARRQAKAPRGLTLKAADGSPLKAWGEIEITFLSRESVAVRTRGTLVGNYNYAELGFEDKRSNKSSTAWGLLIVLAQKSGEIPTSFAGDFQKAALRQDRVRHTVKGLRDGLKALFSEIEGDPIPIDSRDPKHKAYKAQFLVNCQKSFDAETGPQEQAAWESRPDVGTDSEDSDDAPDS